MRSDESAAPTCRSQGRLQADYHAAQSLALAGRTDEALATYGELESSELPPELRSLVANDRGVLAALSGQAHEARQAWRTARKLDPECAEAWTNRAIFAGHVDSTAQQRRIAVVSLLFNWPSTGGGTIHTKELCQFLQRDGHVVRHLFAANTTFGVGQVTEPLPYDAVPLHFDNSSWQADEIRRRFHDAVDEFDPDCVIITDSWNTKPLLVEAVREFPYFLRIAAQECLCPLNNVRLLIDDQGEPQQCQRHQLEQPHDCRACVQAHQRLSGRLHQAERHLAGFFDADYPQRLQLAFQNAAGVLAVNPTTAQLVAPFTQSVEVLPSGFDRGRFPEPRNANTQPSDSPTTILFAGLVDEWMKGFHVLQATAEQLWNKRQDFEVIATADPVGPHNEFTRFVGWQSQEELPRLMSEADLVVFPTIAQEALGRSAVEAMACGRPVVASRIGGLPWVLNDEECGLLFEPGDPDDLAQKLAQLLDGPDLRTRLGQAGRQRFEDQFTWDVILPRYRELFTAVTPSAPTTASET